MISYSALFGILRNVEANLYQVVQLATIKWNIRMGVQSGFHTPVYPSMKWFGNGDKRGSYLYNITNSVRVIIECHHRSWFEVVLICKGPWLTSWKIVFRYWWPLQQVQLLYLLLERRLTWTPCPFTLDHAIFLGNL